MSIEQKIDYEIMQSLSSLLEFEMQEALTENDFNTYKGKSKAVLSKLLVKLEDNAEYHKYLEGEVKRLEEIEKKFQDAAASNEEKTAESSRNVSYIQTCKYYLQIITFNSPFVIKLSSFRLS